MILAGVEEAGRGPVIGPLVLAIAAIDSENEGELEKIGVKDSKELTPREREDLFDKIKDLCQTKIIIVWPDEVDKALASKDSNLNWLQYGLPLCSIMVCTWHMTSRKQSASIFRRVREEVAA